jgi:hypothetical protein
MSTLATGPTADDQRRHLVVDPFCFRQFAEHEDASKAYGGTVFSLSVHDFEMIANSLYSDDLLREGYAPFCKHLFLPVNAFFLAEESDKIPRVNVLPVVGNEHLIRTSYAARNEKEVPVLQRFIPIDALDGPDRLPAAKYLDLILYSREQIEKENESMGKQSTSNDETTVPWGIVSIKAQLEDYELPMNPITQMRNALGTDQGGSGIPLNREEYMKSVEYWSANVAVS